MDLNSILSHSENVVTRKTGNEYVLVPVTDNIADMDSVYTLNETGAFIWDKIDGKRSISDIILLVTDEFEVDRAEAETDVRAFLSDMTEHFMIDRSRD